MANVEPETISRRAPICSPFISQTGSTCKCWLGRSEWKLSAGLSVNMLVCLSCFSLCGPFDRHMICPGCILLLTQHNNDSTAWTVDGVLTALQWVENRKAAPHKVNQTIDMPNTDHRKWRASKWTHPIFLWGEMGFEECWVIEVHHCGESGSVKHDNLYSKAFAMHFSWGLLAALTTCHRTATSEIIVLSELSRFSNIKC